MGPAPGGVPPGQNMGASFLGDRQALTSPFVSGQKTMGRPEGGTLQTGSLFSPVVLASQGFGVVISLGALEALG